MHDKDYKYTINEFAEMQKGEWPRKVDLQRLSNKSLWGMNLYTKAFKKIEGKIMVNEDEFWKAFEATPSPKKSRRVFNLPPYRIRSEEYKI